MDKPTLPPGTRDFGPAQMAKRQFIFNTIRTVFQKYGFMPLETPTMENLTTLLGKYGDEGDQLLFRIVDSGDYFKKGLSPFSRKYFETQIEYLIGQVATGELARLQSNKPTQDLLSFFKDKINQKRIGLDQNEKDDILLNSYFEYDLQFISDICVEVSKNAYNQTTVDRYKEKILARISAYFTQFPTIKSSRDLLKTITEKGLRYDLTVPFARYVVMNRGEITLPFKRYQIQPVWRADRPQKGRYREFYQCDADVVGTDSLVNEAEIVLMIQEVFKGIGITDYTIKINHRGILSGLAEISNVNSGPVVIKPGTGELKFEGYAPTVTVTENSLFVAIDKLDKIGEDKVKEEMKERGISETSAQQVFDILNFKGSNEQKLDLLKNKFANSEKGKKGVHDLENVFKIVTGFNATATNNQQPTTNNVELDISLARGLSYYTGTIFEVKVNNVAIGSVSGGGRYDNLTQAFGAKERLSGVGISFGIDRLYDVLEELKLFPKEATLSSKVLVTHLDEACMVYGLGVTQAIRNQGIACEIYPEVTKVKKQLEYADRKQIPFAIVIGSEEVSSGILTLKNLATGEQEKLKIEDVIHKLK